MIVLRTPKGWSAPREVDGHLLEGFWRAHQIPITDVRTNPPHLKLLETWMKGYKPEELFDKNGKLIPELKELAPTGNSRMSANPVGNGGLLRRPLNMPDFRKYGFTDIVPGSTIKGGMANMAKFLRDLVAQNMKLSDSSVLTRLSRTSLRRCTKLAKKSGWAITSKKIKMEVT